MCTAGHTILIAQSEGDRSDAFLFQILLAEAGLDGLTTIATTSREAVEALLERGGIDLVLLLTAGGQAEGGKTLAQIRAAYPAVPVVVVADSVDRELAWRTIASGAEDCLLRSELSSAVVGRAVRYAIERKRNETTGRRLERYDPLTGLLTPISLLALLARLFERREKRRDFGFAVLVAGVEGFYGMTLRYGRLFADELLIALARRLEQAARPGDAAARLNEHELALVLPEINGRQEARAVAARIGEAMTAPVAVRQVRLSVAVKWGIATTRELFDGPHDMLGAAVLDLKCS